MNKTKSTKRALLASILSLLLCVTMLIGSTFAWFTDSVTSGNNKIVAGNLDVELEYLDADGQWQKVTDTTVLFSALEADGETENLWEPGHTEIVYLKVTNAGNLALQYNLTVTASNETEFENALGETGKKLSEFLVFGQVESDDEIEEFESREDAWEAAGSTLGLASYRASGELLETGDAKYIALIVYMPTTVGNEANYRGDVVPSVDLGVTLFATQTPYERDSFGDDYDEFAAVEVVEATPDSIADVLSEISGDAVITLTPGEYDLMTLGVPSASENSGTVYVCPDGSGHNGTPLTFTSAEEFKAHYDGKWHGVPQYTRTIDNLTFVGQEGVVVKGLTITSGHINGNNVYDPVKGENVGSSGYYLTQNISNVTFKDITFEGNVNINTSRADTELTGFTFEGCSFTTGGTRPADAAGLRFYNESNNGKVNGLTVKGCTFKNCYQGIYAANVNTVSVTECEFDTTGHNAIALQSTVHGAVDYKAVVIEGNTFNKIGDRIIRFGNIAADTQLTITGNTATESGDTDGQVMKADSLADGITYDIRGNSWGDGKIVANDQLKDAQ